MSMKGDPKIIAHLNKVLANELVAINQYFLHARIYDDWGLKGLGHKRYHESIDEMKHADELVKRVLFLKGCPTCRIWASCASVRRWKRCCAVTCLWRWTPSPT
jgi:bacterioferritin